MKILYYISNTKKKPDRLFLLSITNNLRKNLIEAKVFVFVVAIIKDGISHDPIKRM